jgi:hypothetical protein
MFRPVISLQEIEIFLINGVLPISSPETLSYVPETMLCCAGDSVGHWDARWWYSVFSRNGLAAAPNVSLARNIGYGEQATHTRIKEFLHFIPLRPLGAITHPTEVAWTKYADEVDYRIVFSRVVNTRQGLVNELRRRIVHGDPEESILFLEKIGKKYFADISGQQ